MTTREHTVRLEAFEGPLDLLLYLIRRAEVDLHDIPVATITEQYCQSLTDLDRIDIERAGEFLLMAATLIEIKSRMLAPRPEGGSPRDEASVQGGDDEDPRSGLVAQLLAYKRFRDAADALEHRFDEWQDRVPSGRAGIERAREALDEQEIDLDDLSVVDLVEAFARLAEVMQFERLGAHEVLDDDTPLELHAEDLVDQLARAGASGEARVPLRAVFEGRRRIEMIGLFLAMLELVRQRRLIVRQDDAGSVLIGLRAEVEGDPARAAGVAESPVD